MIRQTFYISDEISHKLKEVAHTTKTKISNLVNEALRGYLNHHQKKSEKSHSLLAAAGKIKCFRNSDPIALQKKLRKDWDAK